MSNVRERFVYVSHPIIFIVSYLIIKHLQSSLGFDVARSSSDSVSEKDIIELIDTDLPKVIDMPFYLWLVFIARNI